MKNNSILLFKTHNGSGGPEAVSRFFRVFLLYQFRALRFQKEELDQMAQDLPKITQPMFESTYDMLIREGEIKGEAIGIVIGEQKRSLEIVLDGIVYMPTLSDADIARFAKLPEPFVTAMRGFYLKNEIYKAQEAAADLFSGLTGFCDYDLDKIKKAVKVAWVKQAEKE